MKIYILENVWIPAFKKAYYEFEYMKFIVTIISHNVLIPEIKAIKYSLTCENKEENKLEGFNYIFPYLSNCDELIHDCLFVNSCDPHSIFGNGNSMENSVDGYFGRSTAISILAWPLTNEFIKNKIFRITSINSINSINEFKELQFLTDYKNSEKPTEFNYTNCVSDLYSGYDQNVYNNGKTFKPPEWVLDQSENLIEEYGKDTEVYVTQVDLPEYQLRNIHRLLTERERVNIGMNNYNNQLFSWGKSYYSRYYNRHKELPPNIAVYYTSHVNIPMLS